MPDFPHDIPLVQLAPIRSRLEFPGLLADRGLLGVAAEIGTHRAQFAEAFLTHWPGRRLICIDHYRADYDLGDPASYGDREADYRLAQGKLRRFGGRARLWRTISEQAAWETEEETLDFAYIDACHQYESIKQDITLWWPKVAPGGLLAGHDFVCPGEDDGGWGRFVQPAVFEHALAEHVTVWMVVEPTNNHWSYYMVKP